MAITAAELLVKIGADDSGLRRGLSSAEGMTSSFGSKLRSMAGIGVKAFAVVGAAGVAVVGTGLKIAADMEQARIGFETMLGSAEKADEFLGQLKDFAAKTPFEFPELQSAASRLVAVGTNAEDVIPIMSALGDSTSAMGTGAEGIQRAVMALSQMRQKGKVTGEEMLQLAEAGVPAWDALAAHMGMTVPEVQKLVSAGKVQVDDLMSAIENREGEAMARVTGMMDKQSQTLAGLFSTLKDSVGMALADSAAPLIDALKPVIPAFSETLGQLVGSLGKGFGPVLGQLVSIVAKLMPVLAPVLEVVGEALAQALEELAPAITPIAEAFGAIVVALAPFLPVIAKVIATVATLAAELISALVPVLEPLIDALLPPFLELFDALAPVIGDLIPPVIQIVKALAGLLLAITPILGPITKLIGFAVKLAAALTGKVAGALSTVIGWVSKAVGSFGALWNFVKDLPAKVGNAFGRVRDAIVNAFKAAINYIISAWNRLDFGIHITIPSWVPLVGGKGFNVDDIFPDIPMLAKGGIVTGPTLAMVGERGPEAVVPLSGGGGMPLTVNVSIDRRTFPRQADYFQRVSGL